jgi:hypothetical protein
MVTIPHLTPVPTHPTGNSPGVPLAMTAELLYRGDPKEAAMLRARMGKEIVVKTANEIGLLNQISKVVAEKGVNILAVQGVVDDGKAVLRIVTSDNLRVGDALRAKNFAPQEMDCVLVEVPNKPGVLRTITEKLSAQAIDLQHLYATAGESSSTSLVALASSHNDRAIVALNK